MKTPRLSTRERKDLLLQQLEKTPLVQSACQKTGISRATYYVWRKDDPDFKVQADANIRKARWLINDLAESKLMEHIRDSKPWAIRFWLTHNHAVYMRRIPVQLPQTYLEAASQTVDKSLLQQALTMASYALGEPEQKQQNPVPDADVATHRTNSFSMDAVFMTATGMSPERDLVPTYFGGVIYAPPLSL